MTAVLRFLRKEPILAVSALSAIVSSIMVPPDAAYLQYIDFRTLALLYALMLVVAGLRQAGAFERLAHLLCARAKTARGLGTLLVAMTFFSSMLITNDVALLTFVPFAVVLLGMSGRKRDLIPVVVLQTVAANLGSMLTPVGNPQNLALYFHYRLSAGDFFRITGPMWALSLVLCLLLCLGLPRAALRAEPGETPRVDRRKLWMFVGLFAVCLAGVFRLIPWPVMLGITVAALLLSGFTDNARELLLGVDVGGLGTPIASLASLISLKLYSRSEGARTGRYLGAFLIVNIVLLAALSAARRLF